MIIRKAKKSDVNEIYELILDASKRGKILKRTREDIKNSINNFSVAVINGKIIGCAAVDIYSKKLAEIRSVATKKNFENMGVASKLIKSCIEKAKKHNVYELLVITDEINLFKRLGFKEELENQKALFLRLRKW